MRIKKNSIHRQKNKCPNKCSKVCSSFLLIAVAIALMSLSELAGQRANAQGFEPSETRRIPAPEPQTQTRTQGTRSIQKKCRAAFFRYAIPLKQVASELIPTQPKQAEESESSAEIQAANLMMALDANDCSNKERRSSMVKLLTNVLNHHERKVIVMMPPPREPKNLVARIFLSELQKELSSQNKKSLSEIEIPTGANGSGVSKATMIRMLAKTYWYEKPALIVSLLGGENDEVTAEVSKALSIPVVLAGPALAQRNLRIRNPRLFRIFPDQTQIAESLAKAACGRGIKTSGVLMANSPENLAFAETFKREYTRCGGVTLDGGTFVKADFESIDRAIKELTPKFAKLKQPQHSNSPDNHHRNGLIVLEEARIVRHAAKVAQINDLHAIALMGHHKWRSPLILQPYDSFFEGSIFVDMIGPLSSNTGQTALKKMPDQQEIREAIWRLAGKRTGQLLNSLFEASTGYPRRNLHKIILSMPAPNDVVFKTNTFFNEKNESWWPNYIFTISKGSLADDPMVLWDEPGLQKISTISSQSPVKGPQVKTQQ